MKSINFNLRKRLPPPHVVRLLRRLETVVFSSSFSIGRRRVAAGFYVLILTFWSWCSCCSCCDTETMRWRWSAALTVKPPPRVVLIYGIAGTTQPPHRKRTGWRKSETHLRHNDWLSEVKVGPVMSCNQIRFRRGGT